MGKDLKSLILLTLFMLTVKGFSSEIVHENYHYLTSQKKLDSLILARQNIINSQSCYSHGRRNESFNNIKLTDYNNFNFNAVTSCAAPAAVLTGNNDQLRFFVGDDDRKQEMSLKSLLGDSYKGKRSICICPLTLSRVKSSLDMKECSQQALRCESSYHGELRDFNALKKGIESCFCPYTGETLFENGQAVNSRISKCKKFGRMYKSMEKEFLLARSNTKGKDLSLDEILEVYKDFFTMLPEPIFMKIQTMDFINMGEKEFLAEIKNSVIGLTLASQELTILVNRLSTSRRSLTELKYPQEVKELIAKYNEEYGLEPGFLYKTWEYYFDKIVGERLTRYTFINKDYTLADLKREFLPYSNNKTIIASYVALKAMPLMETYVSARYEATFRSEIEASREDLEYDNSQIMPIIERAGDAINELKKLSKDYPGYIDIKKIQGMGSSAIKEARANFKKMVEEAAIENDGWDTGLFWKWLPKTGEAIVTITAGNALYWGDRLINGDDDFETNAGNKLIEYIRKSNVDAGIGSIYGTRRQMAESSGNGFVTFLKVNPVLQGFKGIGDIFGGVLDGVDELYTQYSMAVLDADSKVEYWNMVENSALLRAGRYSLATAEATVGLIMVATSGNPRGLIGAASKIKNLKSLSKGAGALKNPALRLSRIQKIHHLTNLKHLSQLRRSSKVAGALSGAGAIGQEFTSLGSGGEFNLVRLGKNTVRGTTDSIVFMGGLGQIAQKVGSLSKNSSPYFRRQKSAVFAQRVDLMEGMAEKDQIAELWAKAENGYSHTGAAIATIVNLFDTYDVTISGVVDQLANGKVSKLNKDFFKISSVEWSMGLRLTDIQKANLIAAIHAADGQIGEDGISAANKGNYKESQIELMKLYVEAAGFKKEGEKDYVLNIISSRFNKVEKNIQSDQDVSGESQSSLEVFRDNYFDFDLGINSKDNRRLLDEYANSKTPKENVEIASLEMTMLKELNDHLTKDKSVSQSLMNFYKSEVLKLISKKASDYGVKIEAKYSDYKSLRFAFSYSDKASYNTFLKDVFQNPELTLALTEALTEINLIDDVYANPKLMRLADWFIFDTDSNLYVSDLVISSKRENPDLTREEHLEKIYNEINSIGHEVYEIIDQAELETYLIDNNVLWLEKGLIQLNPTVWKILKSSRSDEEIKAKFKGELGLSLTQSHIDLLSGIIDIANRMKSPVFIETVENLPFAEAGSRGLIGVDLRGFGAKALQIAFDDLQKFAFHHTKSLHWDIGTIGNMLKINRRRTVKELEEIKRNLRIAALGSLDRDHKLVFSGDDALIVSTSNKKINGSESVDALNLRLARMGVSSDYRLVSTSTPIGNPNLELSGETYAKTNALGEEIEKKIRSLLPLKSFVSDQTGEKYSVDIKDQEQLGISVGLYVDETGRVSKARVLFTHTDLSADKLMALNLIAREVLKSYFDSSTFFQINSQSPSRKVESLVSRNLVLTSAITNENLSKTIDPARPNNELSSVELAVRKLENLSDKDISARLKVITDPLESMALKILAIRKAKTSIDVSYYIIGNDVSGAILINELKKALERGVNVRLMYDAVGSGAFGKSNLYQILHHSEKGFQKDYLGNETNEKATFEVRVIRPLVNLPQVIPHIYKTIKSFFLGDDINLKNPSPNRRSHDKILLVDPKSDSNGVAFVGGINWYDTGQNVGKKEGHLTKDMDYVIKNEARPEFDGENSSGDVFTDYFDYLFLTAKPIEKVSFSSERLEALEKVVENRLITNSSSIEVIENEIEAKEETDALEKGFTQAEFDLLSNIGNLFGFKTGTPESLVRKLRSMRVNEHLDKMVNAAEESITFVSPYFYMGEGEITRVALWLKKNPDRKFTIITNSKATSDNGATQFMFDHITIPNILRVFSKHDVDLGQVEINQLRTNQLHGKLYLVDGEKMIMGTANKDIRSEHLNSEISLGVKLKVPNEDVMNWLKEIDQQTDKVNLKERSENPKVVETIQRLMGHFIRFSGLHIPL